MPLNLRKSGYDPKCLHSRWQILPLSLLVPVAVCVGPLNSSVRISTGVTCTDPLPPPLDRRILPDITNTCSFSSSQDTFPHASFDDLRRHIRFLTSSSHVDSRPSSSDNAMERFCRTLIGDSTTHRYSLRTSPLAHAFCIRLAALLFLARAKTPVQG